MPGAEEAKDEALMVQNEGHCGNNNNNYPVPTVRLVSVIDDLGLVNNPNNFQGGKIKYHKQTWEELSNDPLVRNTALGKNLFSFSDLPSQLPYIFLKGTNRQLIQPCTVLFNKLLLRELSYRCSFRVLF